MTVPLYWMVFKLEEIWCERLERHEKTEYHKEAVLKLTTMQGPSIIAQLNSETRRTQATRRNMLLKQLSSLKYLLRQGLPIRGHKECRQSYSTAETSE